MKYKGKDYKFLLLPKKHRTMESLAQEAKMREQANVILHEKLDDYIRAEMGMMRCGIHFAN